MGTASLSAAGVGFSMPRISHTVISGVNPHNHRMCGARSLTKCDIARMADKNAGPNHLKAWREFRKLSQAGLAERVGTNQNMIAYLESGERGLSAKWLRKLAPALNTTPGHLLDHDPHEMDADIIDIWMAANQRERRQLADVAKAIIRTGTDDR